MLLAKKMVSCTDCGDTEVRKALMAPKVSTSDSAAITAPSPKEHSLARLKKAIEANADDVGSNFTAEARAMHDGLKPERAIYGQATGKETKEMLADGVPITPLPFIPTKKTN